MASELTDEGYGQFEVCLKELKRRNADVAATKKALSKKIRALAAQLDEEEDYVFV